MARRKRRHFTAEQKLTILREHLLEGKSVSEVCDKHDVRPGSFYQWQKKLFENGSAAFANDRDSRERQLERKVENLEAKLAHKDHVIARVTEEFVRAKKESGEL